MMRQLFTSDSHDDDAQPSTFSERDSVFALMMSTNVCLDASHCHVHDMASFSFLSSDREKSRTFEMDMTECAERRA